MLVTIFSEKNRAILVQKLLGEKKLSKSVFGYFRKKSSDGHLARGGGGMALMAWPLVEDFFFFAASLRQWIYEDLHLHIRPCYGFINT